MRRIVRSIVGSIVLLVGLMMLVLPGPGLVVIPLGLAILAIDFPWAKVAIQKIRAGLMRKKPSRPRSSTHIEAILIPRVLRSPHRRTRQFDRESRPRSGQRLLAIHQA